MQVYETDFKDSSNQDSVTATFRLGTRVMNKLRSESEKRQISLNAYINQVLRQHTEWDLFEPKIGLIPFPKQVLASIFSGMDQAEISKLANGIGKSTAIDMAIFVQGKFNADTFLSWFETRMKNSGCEVAHRVEGEKQTVVIKHDLGKNWSLYLKTMLESALKESFGKVPESFITDSLVSLAWKN
jgi:hypothetical protein